MDIRVLQTLADVEQTEVSWRGLYENAANRQIFLSFDWHYCWLNTFQQYVHRLFVFCVYDDGELVALLPLYQHVREPFQLRFIGTGEPEHSEVCSEYHDVLVRTASSDALISTISDALNQTGKALSLDNVRTDSVLRLICQNVYPAELSSEQQVQTRFFLFLESDELDGTRLKKKARRFYNLVSRLGGELTICDRADELPAYMGELMSLHKKRWGKDGRSTIFDDEDFVRFHHSLAQSLLVSGELLLACLRIDGRPVSAFYGMAAGESVFFYQSGIDEGFSPNVSPGTVIHYYVAMEARKRGFKVYDFLGSGSADDYKSRLTAEQEPLMRFSGYRSTFQKMLCRSYHLFYKFRDKLNSRL